MKWGEVLELALFLLLVIPLGACILLLTFAYGANGFP